MVPATLWTWDKTHSDGTGEMVHLEENTEYNKHLTAETKRHDSSRCPPAEDTSSVKCVLCFASLSPRQAGLVLVFT